MKSPTFNYIIIGSGMGGSACAYALTKAGQSVLLLEAGQPVVRDDKDWDGLEVLVKGRYKSDRPVYVSQFKQKKHTPQPQDEALGGKTVLYGGASFRLREKDFQAWDLSYQDFSRWYDLAETHLEVHGQAGLDPFEPMRKTEYLYPASKLSDPSVRIQKAAQALGLKPFPIPMAINTGNPNRPLCIRCNTCDGFPCKIQAKNDAFSCFLQKADSDLLHIETGMVVDQIEMDHAKANRVLAYCKKTKKKKTFTAQKIIVSAGAIESAGILLRSKIQDPSKMLGRNLMRHCNAVVGCLFPFQTNPQNTFHKQIALTDHYEQGRQHHGYATGVIQDIYMPPQEVLRYFVPFGIKTVTTLLRERIQNLLCVAEDEPQQTNRVELKSNQDFYGIQALKVYHQYTKEDLQRRQVLIATAKKILKKAGGIATLVRDIDTFSHAVGTLRFGKTPKQSVLDLTCRVHGVDNLFVVDGSFMPTSAGVNPSLTIAANALRVCYELEGDKTL